MNGPPPADLRERLQSSLGSAYAITRELGGEDLRHKRRVAVKVLKPELAAVLGAERFVSVGRRVARGQRAAAPGD